MMMVVVLVDLHRGGAGEGGPFGYMMYVHSVRLVVTEPHFLLRNPPEDLNSFTVTCYQSTSTTMKIPKKYPEYCNNHAATAWSKIKWFLSKPDLIGRWLSWQDFQVYIIILRSEALMAWKISSILIARLERQLYHTELESQFYCINSIASVLLQQFHCSLTQSVPVVLFETNL